MSDEEEERGKMIENNNSLRDRETREDGRCS